ncbi:CaiB/BaiF CoA transferase family protein [Microbacterium sp. No. 7]|uniref:CaiB/BaiF CoA transferase family protein n=1 Tax=Microbacterium sp. No. 7 TaxID=1714373 RepID=UPI0006CFD469|nr:CaiB/BaiF CoA-transferase family protein [Microbacterium sp. No. 7]ALJ19293.1 carnitine dehydratase [Microbacterium sp. No. 7]
MTSTGPLNGLRVIEVGAIGPGPWCAMMLSDMGAEVIRVDRAAEARAHRADGPPPIELVTRRGRKSVALDLKRPEGVEALLRLVESADALIEGFRPGVAERLGIGPDACLARNPRLVYGRMTGWGQDGPLAQVPGHDLNYLALTGILSTIGPAERPVPPLNLVGDFGGGGLLLAFGVLAGVLSARATGEGQVIDAAMTEGASLLGGLLHGMHQIGMWKDQREANRHDGGSPHYNVYETADGGFVAVAANEPQFYRALVEALGWSLDELPPQYDQDAWPQMRQRFAAAFKERTRDEWVALMAGVETCFSPVLTLAEAREHEHNVARGAFVPHDGIVQPAPAPHFARTPGRIQGPAAFPGEHSVDVLSRWGFTDAEIAALQDAGAVATLPEGVARG